MMLNNSLLLLSQQNKEVIDVSIRIAIASDPIAFGAESRRFSLSIELSKRLTGFGSNVYWLAN